MRWLGKFCAIVREENKVLYATLRMLVRLFFQVCCRWRILGLENMPANGPVVVAANHISWWDPIVVGCALERQVHFMAKKELFQIPIVGGLISRLGTFPVRRGRADRTAIKQALKLLEEGKVLGIFPEGTRSKSGELQKPHPGAAMISLKASAPIVPVACIGTRNMFSRDWFRPITVNIGSPLIYEQHFGKKLTMTTLETVSQEIMDEIGKLMAGFNDDITK